MTFMRTLALGVLVFTTISSNAASVWKVSKGDNSVYIGGTIHILKQENFPLPIEYETAYSKADEVYFETDIAATKLPAFQQKMMTKIVLTDGSTLESFLTEETFAALKAHIDSRGLPIANFLPLKPSAVALMLSVLEYQANGFLQEGVDAFYASKASADKKPQRWLESVDEQLNLIVNMGKGDEENLIKYTLEELSNVSSQMEQLLTIWERGDMDAMNTLIIQSMQVEVPDLYNNLLKNRNNKWMPKLVQMFDDKDTEFVLVGAAHLAGEDGVLKKLAAQGFQIEKL